MAKVLSCGPACRPGDPALRGVGATVDLEGRHGFLSPSTAPGSLAGRPADGGGDPPSIARCPRGPRIAYPSSDAPTILTVVPDRLQLPEWRFRARSVRE